MIIACSLIWFGHGNYNRQSEGTYPTASNVFNLESYINHTSPRSPIHSAKINFSSH